MGTPSPFCRRVAQSLAQGNIALLPSDGLYVALCCVSSSDKGSIEDRLSHVFSLCGTSPKSREPLLAFVRRFDDLEAWNMGLPTHAAALARALWPGPLSLTCKSSSQLEQCLGTQGASIEVHCPKQSFLAQVLAALHEERDASTGQPPMLVGLWAHKPGEIPVSNGRWLPRALGKSNMPELLQHASFVIDAGPTTTGTWPTAIEVRKDQLLLVREGPIELDAIQTVVGDAIVEKARAFPSIKRPKVVIQGPTQGLAPVPNLDADTWTIGVGPRPPGCDHARWIELYPDSKAFIAEYFDALHRAADAGAEAIYVRSPSAQVSRRIGLSDPDTPQRTSEGA